MCGVANKLECCLTSTLGYTDAIGLILGRTPGNCCKFLQAVTIYSRRCSCEEKIQEVLQTIVVSSSKQSPYTQAVRLLFAMFGLVHKARLTSLFIVFNGASVSEIQLAVCLIHCIVEESVGRFSKYGKYRCHPASERNKGWEIVMSGTPFNALSLPFSLTGSWKCEEGIHSSTRGACSSNPFHARYGFTESLDAPKACREIWKPTDFLPDPASEGFNEQVKELRERCKEIPDDYFLVLIGDMITEETLPTYQTMINTLDGVRDGTGASLTPWAIWTRAWTAEENGHGDLLNKYFIFLEELI
ncbi:hypothetical protein KY290_007083 [Solanum tuberosum]|uniref:Acyl-[acyl-carrier-protein] desaturase n=1 Tax=Solanum tuberosum TaxID=4113 RepID=A0ABQ7W4I7_SOLTU|nr:hypothetical protein KY290_007083 [Solanum tuberosum]